MDNEAYNAICNILNHELREQDHAVLAERIRIASAVLPADIPLRKSPLTSRMNFLSKQSHEPTRMRTTDERD